MLHAERRGRTPGRVIPPQRDHETDTRIDGLTGSHPSSHRAEVGQVLAGAAFARPCTLAPDPSPPTSAVRERGALTSMGLRVKFAEAAVPHAVPETGALGAWLDDARDDPAPRERDTVTDVQKEELQEEAQKILPIYIAVDRSWSMNDDGKIDAANDLIPAIIDACVEHPLADQKARFSVIGFNDQAEVVARLSRGTNLTQHRFVASSGTSFTAVFRLLVDQLESDYQQLKADGYRVHRPAVFLLTDGEPICNANDRQKAFDALTAKSFARRPNISVFGVGNQVKAETISEYTTDNGLALLTRDGVNAGNALEGFISVLVQSIVNSTGKDAGTGDNDFEWDLEALEDDDFLLGLES